MSSRRIKVLFAINCLNIGGAPSVVVNQLKALDRSKFDPHLLTLYPSKAANFLAEVNNFLPTAKQHHFRLKKRSVFDFRTLWQIYRFLRRERFKIIYTHLFLCNLLVRALAILARVPVIVTFEHSTYFNKKVWQVTADRWLKRFTAQVVTSTLAVAQFTSQQQGLAAGQITVIPNPVVIPPPESDFLAAYRRSLALTAAEVIFLTIGRFSEEKGYDVLLAAAAASQAPARFLLVGHGPQESALHTKIAELGLTSKVLLINEPERAKQFLYLAQAFILPSRREGQALVVYEALQCGLPVIASDLPALREVITDGTNGLLVPVGSVMGLATAIDKFVQDEGLRAKLEMGATQTVARSTAASSTQALEELFLRLISSNL